MFKWFRHYLWAQAGRSIRLGQIYIIENVLGLLYGEHHIYLNLCSVDILSISAEQVNQPDMQAGYILGLGKLLCKFF